MTTEEIQKETDRKKLYDRITHKDVRKKERRLLRRRIFRIENESMLDIGDALKDNP